MYSFRKRLIIIYVENSFIDKTENYVKSIESQEFFELSPVQ